MPTTLLGKLDFVPHVEGMRALAILLVVAAHAGVPGMEGGVVGVDIFFVISGYLISALLTIEAVNANGRPINLKMFYARRLRRLLPALVLVLTVTGLMAVVLMPDSAHPETAFAGASAALWLANLYFAFAHIDYFGAEAGGNPFLHMWSLGVEEQFYLVWPLLIALIAMRVKGTQQIVLRLGFSLAAVLTVSLIALLWLSATPYALQAYYLTPVRAWQFALGGLIWLVGLRRRDTAYGVRYATMFLLSGFVVIIVATWAPDAHAEDMEWRTLGASFAAALLLAAGSSARAWLPLRLLLVAPPMLAIGRVSYAWYLWHWPVLVLGQLYFLDADLAIRLLLAVVAWALAVLTQRFVEAPFRRRSGMLAWPGRFILTSLLVMAIVIFVFLRWHESAQAHLAAEAEKNRYLAVRWDLPRLYSQDCDDWYHSANLKICRFGATEGERTAVVMGDSVGLHWFPALEAALSAKGWRLLVVTKSACPMVDEPVYYPRIKRYFTECAEWREKAVKAIVAMRPSMVVLGSSFGYGFDEAQWVAGSRRLLERLVSATQRLYVIRASPTLPFDGLECLSRRGAASATAQSPCSVEWDDKANRQVWRWLGEAVRGLDNVVLLDLNDLVCPNRICAAERDGFVVYRDKLHITARFSASLAEAVGDRMGVEK